MTSLRVDTDRMRTVGTDLGRIAGEFEQADARTGDLSEAIGHSGLADAVRSFSRSWDDTRESMIGGIRGLGEASTAIADAFTQVDSDLAHALTDPAPAVATPADRAIQ